MRGVELLQIQTYMLFMRSRRGTITPEGISELLEDTLFVWKDAKRQLTENADLLEENEDQKKLFLAAAANAEGTPEEKKWLDAYDRCIRFEVDVHNRNEELNKAVELFDEFISVLRS